MDFTFTLKNENGHRYRWLFLLLVLLNSLGLWYLAIIGPSSPVIPGLATLILILVALVEIIYRDLRWRLPVYLALLILWTITPWYFMAFILLLLGWLEYVQGKKKILVFSADHILFPSLFTKKLAWDDLSNVILKDDLLTIDFRNNRLFQAIISEGKNKTDEIIFNEFCLHQLNKETLPG
jgi:hypothetical protein